MDGYKEGCKLWIGPFLYFVTQKPEDVKIIINSEDCHDKPLLEYTQTFSYGLLSMNGDEYRTQRKAITPLFSPKALRSYIPRINIIADKFLVDFDSNLKSKTFDILDDMLKVSLVTSLQNFFDDQTDEKTCASFLKSSKS